MHCQHEYIKIPSIPKVHQPRAVNAYEQEETGLALTTEPSNTRRKTGFFLLGNQAKQFRRIHSH